MRKSVQFSTLNFAVIIFSGYKKAFLFAIGIMALLVNTGLAQRVHLTGRAYFDNNGNHVFDIGDVVLVNGEVSVYNPDSAYYVMVNTNASGYYSIDPPIGLCYLYIFNSDQLNYKMLEPPPRIYTAAVEDVADFAFQKKDSIESTYCGLYTDTYTSIQNGSTASYKIQFEYSGSWHPVTAKLALDFSPLATLASSSLPPVKSTPGHAEWNLTNVERPSGNIQVSIKFQTVGDTIGAFILQPTFSINGYSNDSVSVSNVAYKQYISHLDKTFSGSATQGVKWLRTFSGVPNNLPYSAFGVDTSQDGSAYFMTGVRGFYEPIYSNNAKNYEPVVTKLSKDGLTVWEKYLSPIAYDFSSYCVTRVKHTRDGGCIAAGYKNNFGIWTIKEMLVMKFDRDGNVEWYKQYGGAMGWEEKTCDIVELETGYLITGSAEKGDGVFDHNHPDTLHSNIYVARLSGQGDLIWQKLYGGSRDDEPVRIVPLRNGTFMILGTTQSEDGDVSGAHNHRYTGPDSYGDSAFAAEAWLININADGNVIWNNCYGGTGESRITGLAESNGGYMVAGTTDSKDGDLSDYEESNVPLWILQLSETGNILRTREYKSYVGYRNADYLASDYKGLGSISTLHKTKDGNFIIGVNSNNSYGTITSNHRMSDILLVKFTPEGDILWKKAVGGNDDDFLNDIQIDWNDDIIFTGRTSSVNDDLYESLNGATSLMLVGKLGITNTISGQVFTDLNGNHIKDGNEMYNNEGRIYSAKQNDTTIARIFGGQFLNNVDTGNYVTTYVPASEYFTVFPASKNSAFNSFDQSDSVDFALVPKPNIKDLQTVITPLTPARPGFESSYRIITKNVGTSNITNAVISLKKDSRQTYTSASRIKTGIAVDSVWWGPFTINAFTNDTLDVVLTQAVPPILQNGDTLNIALYALPLAGDTTPANNKAGFRQIVQGSFDPNDKTEAHAGIYTPTMKASNEPFQYLIRFQNTGTDTAFYVTVKDTLDAKVDVNSLETITASHPYKFSLEGRIATWQFNKILLVDSTTNESASHGFISFTIRPSVILKLGDSVSNKAAIYFDFNLPVITNKSLLVLVSDKSVICPGGSTQFQAGQTGIAYQWQIDTGSGFTNLANGGIYSGAATPTLLVSNAPSSLYGTQYRCIISLQGGSKINGDTYRLTFSNTWTGAISTAWENAANWSCGTVPDENTDVIIKAGTPNTPAVSASTAVRSITAGANARLMVKEGVVLQITGHSAPIHY